MTTLAATTSSNLPTLFLVFGLLLALGAAAAVHTKRTVLSMTALFFAAGLVIGPLGLHVVTFHADAPWVAALATLTLVLILFKDGLEVDYEVARSDWHLPVRALLLAMPVTVVLTAVLGFALGLTALQAFILAALLAPTDPVLSSGVILNRAVPARIRHTLHLESGLNDGLALPLVLVGVALLSGVDRGPVEWTWWIGQDLGLGLAYGVAIGFAAAALMPRADEHFQVLYGFGVALLTYAACGLLPHGNGLVATFVAAAVMGWRRPATQELFHHRSDEVIELLKMGTFVVVGALITGALISEADWEGLVISLAALAVIRPLAVLAAFWRTEVPVAERLFIGWFGPRGVATVAFGLLVLPYEPRVFAIATMTVCLSIVLHGLTDTLGADWIARRSKAREDASEADVDDLIFDGA